jgi:hypothetical protein
LVSGACVLRWPCRGPPTIGISKKRRNLLTERQGVLAVLHEPRFVDLAPAEVHARLLDEGRYL